MGIVPCLRLSSCYNRISFERPQTPYTVELSDQKGSERTGEMYMIYRTKPLKPASENFSGFASSHHETTSTSA